jgi:tetratricopeptide (TPR) repeat protein
VSIKVNAEKGEGPGLARKFGVKGFPTLLVVDSRGEELDRFSGFRKPADFIAELKPILDGRSFGAFKKRLAKNPADFDAALQLGRRYEARQNLSEANKLYQRVAQATDAPANLRGLAEGRLVLLRFLQDGNVEPLKAHLDKYIETDDVADHAMHVLQQAMAANDTPTVVKAGDYLLAHGHSENARLLNAYAWYLSMQGIQLKRALEFAQKAVKLSPDDSYILDTLAEAQARNGMPQEAIKTAERAVKHAPYGPQRTELEARLAKFKEAAAEK